MQIATEAIISVYLVRNPNGYTIQDVYDWLKEVEKLKVPMDTKLAEASLALDYNIPFDTLEYVQYGNSLNHDRHNELIISLHTCSDTYKAIDKETL